MTALEHRPRRHRPRRSQRGAATAAARAGWARQRCVTSHTSGQRFLSCRRAWCAPSARPLVTSLRFSPARGARHRAATVRHLALIWAALSQLSSRVVRAIGAATASSAVRLRFITAPSPDPSLARQRRRKRIRRTITETAGRDSLARVVTLTQLASVLPRVLAVSVARTAVRLRSAAQLIAANARRIGLPADRDSLAGVVTLSQRASVLARQLGAWLVRTASRLPSAAQSSAANVRRIALPAGRAILARVVTFSQVASARARVLGASVAPAAFRARSAIQRSAANARRISVPAIAAASARFARQARAAAQTTAMIVRPATRNALEASVRAGRKLRPRSVAAAGAIVTLVVIALPYTGVNDFGEQRVRPTAAAAMWSPTAEQPVLISKRPETSSVLEEFQSSIPSAIASVAASTGALVPANSARRLDPPAIQAVLNRYRDAVSMLDVTGVREVWPNANVEALQREFAGIRDQNLEFEGCRISSVGTTASASCAGVLETGFRAGGRRPRVERRLWQFTLRKSGEAWRITQLQTPPS